MAKTTETKLHTVPIQHVKWVAKALSTDSSRPILTYAAIVTIKGHAWLCATDTHRLHMIYLFPSDAGPTQVVDLRRVIWEARYNGSSFMALNTNDLSEVSVCDSATGLDAIPVRSHRELPGGLFPDVAKVIPDCKKPVKEMYAINLSYFRDAITMAAEGRYRALIYGTTETRPILIRDREDTWRAVIMPMAMS